MSREGEIRFTALSERHKRRRCSACGSLERYNYTVINADLSNVLELWHRWACPTPGHSPGYWIERIDRVQAGEERPSWWRVGPPTSEAEKNRPY